MDGITTPVYDAGTTFNYDGTTQMDYNTDKSDIQDLINSAFNEPSKGIESLTLPSSHELHFSIIDYTLFIAMLLLSALIGIYFGFISKRKQNNTDEYLLGGKSMNPFPISASLIAR